MLTSVFRPGQNLKIMWMVVLSIVIHVVNDFVLCEPPTDFYGSYVSVVIDLSLTVCQWMAADGCGL